MSHLIVIQETINKHGKVIRTLMKENAKLQIVIIENGSLKKNGCKTWRQDLRM